MTTAAAVVVTWAHSTRPLSRPLSKLVKSLLLGWVSGYMASHPARRVTSSLELLAPLTLSTKRKITHKDIAGAQERALVDRYQRGDRAAGEILVRAHEGFIVQYAKRGRGRGLDDEDLFQEARIGFLKGIERYKPAHAVNLTTYARWWMLAGVEKAIVEGGSVVHCPVKSIARVREAKARGIDTAERMAEAGLLPKERAESALAATKTLLSLDVPVSDEANGAAAIDFLVDTSPIADERYEEADEERRTKKTAEKLLRALTPRERDIVLARLGDEPETLLALSERFGVSRQRIQQIQVEAMKKLRNAAGIRTESKDAEDGEDQIQITANAPRRQEEEEEEEEEAPSSSASRPMAFAELSDAG